MPHLTYCNRYWRVAGDEFSVPAFCSIILKLFWTIIIVVCFIITYQTLLDCKSDGWSIILYLIFSIVVFMISIFCDMSLLFISLKGTIIETEKRNNLNFYLNLKFIFGFLCLLCAIYGIIILAGEAFISCDSQFQDSSAHILIIVVVVSQLLDCLSLLCCCYLFSSNKLDEHLQPKDKEWAVDNWENRCRSLTRSIQICSCNLFGGSNITEGFDQVAKVFTDFFHHDGFLDVVPSDVVAGLVLVRLEQSSKRKKKCSLKNNNNSESNLYATKETSTSSVITLSSTSPPFNKKSRRKDASCVKATTSDLEIGSTSCTTISTSSGNGGMNYIHVTDRQTSPNLVDNTIEIIELENIARCSVFALAMYTHLVLIYMRPCTGLCRLCTSGVCIRRQYIGGQNSSNKCISCCCNYHSLRTYSKKNVRNNYHAATTNNNDKSTFSNLNDTVIVGDNLCGLNHSGLDIITEHLSNTELLFVSFVNDTSHKVYAVMLDHDKEQVVIAIRGTLSLEDCITDVICEPVELKIIGEKYGFDGENRYAHGGMLKAAISIYSEIETNETLNKIFGTSSMTTTYSTLQTPLNEKSTYSNYKLVITGHSLGAGAAVLLTLLLRAKFPTLHCYAFGTPGSVLDRNSATEYSSFITSVVINNDMICRLSLPKLCKLRNDVLDAIARAKVNKMLIVQAIFRDFDLEDLMYAKGEEPETAFKKSINEFKSIIDERVRKNHVDLCLPGRILHLTKSELVQRSWCNQTRRELEIHEAQLEDFDEIIMSTSMATDHLPDRYFYEIHRILQRRLKVLTV